METSFFPKYWSKRETAQEIESAFINSSPKAGSSNLWTGTSSSGVKIDGYYGKTDGTGATAWPVYQGKKMIEKKIYYWWLPESKIFTPSGREIGENFRYKPKHGYGACEIASWLSDDLPTGVISVDIWVNKLIEQASNPAPDGFWSTGNAHWVMMTQDKVFLACEYVEEQRVLLTIEQLLYILEQYRDFLTGDFTDPNYPPESIDVEYIAEGDAAVKIYTSLEGSHGVFFLEE